MGDTSNYYDEESLIFKFILGEKGKGKRGKVIVL